MKKQRKGLKLNVQRIISKWDSFRRLADKIIFPYPAVGEFNLSFVAPPTHTDTIYHK
ncbi:MAG: hypothetical protein ACP5EQ_08380 [Candidatus Cloacimonadia bacterium]